MKVLYLTPGVFDKGGISRYGRYQIQALRDLVGTANVRVISMTSPGTDHFEQPFQVEWTSSAIGLRAKLAMTAAIFRLALRFRPDVMWAAHINLSGVSKAIATLIGATSVTQVYGREIWGPQRWDATWGLRKSRYVVSDCLFTARYMEERGLRPLGSTIVLWDCVDVKRFTPGQPDRAVIERYRIPDPDSHVNLLTLGRMTSSACHKGYDRLLKVFSMLRDMSELHLIYAGQGDLIPQLRADAIEMGLEGRVHFLGSIHEDHLVDVYRCAHIFSLVSHWSFGHGEGLPLTPLEAAACGVPIIVGNQDGSAEAVIDGYNGFVVDPFDLVSHAQYVRRLAADVELRRRMGAAARRRVEEEHAYEVFRARMGRFMNAVMRNRLEVAFK